MIKKYYLEIKNRCFLLILTWCFSFFVNYHYKEILLFILLKPNLLYNNNNYFIFTDFREILLIYLKLIIFINNQILLIFFAFHCIIFMSLGLYNFEYKYIQKIFYFEVIFWVYLLFLLNNILLPFSFKFFLNFKNLTYFTFLFLHFEAKLIEYLNFYISFYYFFFTNSQIFIIILLLVDYINLNLELVKKYRKILYYFFFILATLITPPDVLSQIIISFFLILFYEILTFVNIIKKNLG